MARTYYQIELTARQLTWLIIAVALLVIVAFVLGYGAAWSTWAGSSATAPRQRTAQAAAPLPETVLPSPSPTAVVSVMPTATPTIVPPSPTQPATLTPTSAPTATPTARPVRKARRAVRRRVPVQKAVTKAVPRFWVQVLAARHPGEIRKARQRLTKLGFPRSHQEVLKVKAEAGNVLYKLRVGPLPDRASAGRVMQRMRAEGFPDAWVVIP